MSGRNFLFIPDPIGHMGDMNEPLILTPINSVEMAMKVLDYPIELRSGVTAAQDTWVQMLNQEYNNNQALMAGA